jgi:hypothetical protein
MALGQDADRIRLFGEAGGLTGSDRGGRDIPDPWGGGPDEFGHVLDLLGTAAPVIAGRLARLLQPGSGTGPDDARRRTRDDARRHARDNARRRPR